MYLSSLFCIYNYEYIQCHVSVSLLVIFTSVTPLPSTSQCSYESFAVRFLSCGSAFHFNNGWASSIKVFPFTWCAHWLIFADHLYKPRLPNIGTCSTVQSRLSEPQLFEPWTWGATTMQGQSTNCDHVVNLHMHSDYHAAALWDPAAKQH